MTFTGDSSLRYIPDAELEKFVFSPSEGVLYLPLERFLVDNLDENQIIWHIYYELALYSDWKSETKRYLYRSDYWKKEIDYMTGYILKAIKKEGMEADPAYKPKIILNHVRKEILKFLYLFDKYTSFLRVLQLCPIYRVQENLDKIILYIKQSGKTADLIYKMPKYRAFANSFFMLELYKDNPTINKDIKDLFEREIFKQSIFDFIRHQLIMQINKGYGILERDPFIRTFVFPVFEDLWKKEIDGMEFNKSKGQKKDQGKDYGNSFEESEVDEMKEFLESTEEEIEKLLEELLVEKNQRAIELNNAIQNKVDLKQYGITSDDQKLFQYYANKMKFEREEMSRFWKKLIGNAKKEKSIRQDNQIKGKIDIDSFINNYSEFIESEKKGNYKNLSIFSRYLLKPQPDMLPERIEISFLIDNSGSMNPLKIDSARKALAVTLLSIEDLNLYLERNAEQLNQKIEIFSETWFFGSRYYNVKEFNNKSMSKKERSDIIRSIVTINGKDGATDDGSCLKEISDKITIEQENQIRKGKEIKIIFEITDGASSFSGSTKKVVQELLSKNIYIYAFQIGEIIKANEKTFNFVWNEGYKEPHGVIIGQNVESLPTELLRAVGENIQSAFQN